MCCATVDTYLIKPPVPWRKTADMLKFTVAVTNVNISDVDSADPLIRSAQSSGTELSHVIWNAELSSSIAGFNWWP